MAKELRKIIKSKGAQPLMPLWDADRWFYYDCFRKPFNPLVFSGSRFAANEEIMPDVDMFEDDGVIVVKAELPGLKNEDLKMTLTKSILKISGLKKKEEKIKEEDYYKRERSCGTFCRTLQLPAEVQVEKFKTTFKDGVLEVRMPRREKVRSKAIEVKNE